MRTLRLLTAIFCLGGLVAARAHSPVHALSIAQFNIPVGPWLPGSRIPLAPQGLDRSYQSVLVGIGSIIGGTFVVPPTAHDHLTTVIASDGKAIAATQIAIAPPPQNRTVIAVASYDNGIALHDASDFHLLGILAINGHTSDIAIDTHGKLVATDTDGTTALILLRNPWIQQRIANVPFGDEISYDTTSNAFFITGRFDGTGGALIKINSQEHSRSVRVGDTPEGIAIDAPRHRVYVANTNDGTISIVDAQSMHVIKTFVAVPRVFGIALSRNGKTLYAVANQSQSSPFAQNGFVASFDVASANPHLLVRSSPLSFPIGVVADDTHHRIFVTDEELNQVYVFDARTLHVTHPALQTCRTPWKPTIAAGRLYIPCAQSNAIDLFDLKTLQRIHGAPFATAGYPLAVRVWTRHD